MTSVDLYAVRRHGLASRLMHLLNVAARKPVGLISAPNDRDLPTVPRPYISCIALRLAHVEKARDARGLRIAIEHVDLEELRYNWKCEYLGHDDKTGDASSFNATVFQPPRGQPIAFISHGCFQALHGGKKPRIIETAFEDLA